MTYILKGGKFKLLYIFSFMKKNLITKLSKYIVLLKLKGKNRLVNLKRK